MSVFFNTIIQKYPWIKNRYFLVLFGFAIWMFFFDVYNVPMHGKLWLKNQELQEQKAYYQQKISELKQEQHDLFKDDESLERFAREEYLMSRPGEDVYVLEEE